MYNMNIKVGNSKISLDSNFYVGKIKLKVETSNFNVENSKTKVGNSNTQNDLSLLNLRAVRVAI